MAPPKTPKSDRLREMREQNFDAQSKKRKAVKTSPSRPGTKRVTKGKR